MLRTIKRLTRRLAKAESYALRGECLVEELVDGMKRTHSDGMKRSHLYALEPAGGANEGGGLDGQCTNSPDLPANGGNTKRAHGLGRPEYSALFGIAIPMLFLVSFKIFVGSIGRVTAKRVDSSKLCPSTLSPVASLNAMSPRLER